MVQCRSRRLPLNISLQRLALACAAWLAFAVPAVAADVRAEIARKLDIRVEDVKPSPVPGLFEVSSGAEIAYVTADGRFYIHGDVFDMDTRDNLTDRRRNSFRGGLLAAFPAADAVILGAGHALLHLHVRPPPHSPRCRGTP